MTDKIREALEYCSLHLSDIHPQSQAQFMVARQALAALKEIQEVDVDQLVEDCWASTDLSVDDVVRYLHQRGMLRAGVEPIEGLEDALEFARQEKERFDVPENREENGLWTEYDETLYVAARKYLEMEKNHIHQVGEMVDD